MLGVVVGLVLGVMAGYGVGFAVYQSEISKLQSDLSTAQSQVMETYYSVPGYVETERGFYIFPNVTLSLVEVEGE